LLIVVDASLAVKWYLDEPRADEAEGLLLERDGDIVVPDIFNSEVIGALVRRANMDKSKRKESETAILRFAALFETGSLVAIRSHSSAIIRAASIAIDLGHPLKDCIYLVLAMELDCELVTCDARFAEKAKGVWHQVRVLGE
jgi:predicted nucleic acid-binding protein